MKITKFQFAIAAACGAIIACGAIVAPEVAAKKHQPSAPASEAASSNLREAVEGVSAAHKMGATHRLGIGPTCIAEGLPGDPTLCQLNIPLGSPGASEDVSTAATSNFAISSVPFTFSLLYAGGSPTDNFTVQQSYDGTHWEPIFVPGGSSFNVQLSAGTPYHLLRTQGAAGLTGVLYATWVYDNGSAAVLATNVAIPLGASGGAGSSLDVSNSVTFPNGVPFSFGVSYVNGAAGEIIAIQGSPDNVHWVGLGGVSGSATLTGPAQNISIFAPVRYLRSFTTGHTMATGVLTMQVAVNQVQSASGQATSLQGDPLVPVTAIGSPNIWGFDDADAIVAATDSRNFAVVTNNGGAATAGAGGGQGGGFAGILGAGGAGSSAQSGGNGGGYSLEGGAGGVDNGSGAGAGGGFQVTMGVGGAASTSSAGPGGNFIVQPELGGAGSSTVVGGVGSAITITGGPGGADNGGGSGNGGTVSIQAGSGGTVTTGVAGSAGDATLSGGNGAIASASSSAGAAGAANVVGGAGGHASAAHVATVGGSAAVIGGRGGVGTAGENAAQGGSASLLGGQAGTNGGHGGANGGSVLIGGGAPSGAGTAGIVSIGVNSASASTSAILLGDSSAAQSIFLGGDTASTLFDLSPLSASGSVGSAGQIYTSQGAGLAPHWTTPGGSGGLSAYGYAVATATSTVGAAGNVVFNLGGTPYPNTGFTSVPAPGGTSFTVASTGDYEFNFMVAGGIGGASATESLQFALWDNGADIGPQYRFQSELNLTAASTLVVTGSGIVHLTAADVVTLNNQTNSGTQAVTLTSAGAGVTQAGANATLSLKKLN